MPGYNPNEFADNEKGSVEVEWYVECLEEIHFKICTIHPAFLQIVKKKV